MSDTDQIIKDAFMALPKVLQKAITDADVQSKLRKLAEVHKLHLDKWIILENEIMMALLGITNPDDLPETISKRVGIPLEKATQITNAAGEIIFGPIKDQLKNAVGDSKNIIESVGDENNTHTNDLTNQKSETQIDISKFMHAPTDPDVYTPKTPKKYPDNNDPYLEPIDD